MTSSKHHLGFTTVDCATLRVTPFCSVMRNLAPRRLAYRLWVERGLLRQWEGRAQRRCAVGEAVSLDALGGAHALFGSLECNNKRLAPHGSCQCNNKRLAPHGSCQCDDKRLDPHGSCQCNNKRLAPHGSCQCNNKRLDPHGSCQCDDKRRALHDGGFGLCIGQS
eukprot:366429-Chlamydomonas_euryale.AAC.2